MTGFNHAHGLGPRLLDVLEPLLPHAPERMNFAEVHRPVRRLDIDPRLRDIGRPAEGWAVVLRPRPGGSFAHRLLRALRAQRDIELVHRSLASHGFAFTTSYGIYPSARNASILVELEGAAVRYAARCMLPGGRGAARRALEAAMRSMGAPPVCLETFVVIGRRR